MQTLQELVDDRARKRLDSDIQSLVVSFTQHPASRLLDRPSALSHRYGSNIRELINSRDGAYAYVQVQDRRIDGGVGSWRNQTFVGAFGSIYDGYWKQIREAWLPIYIAEESERFLGEMETMRSKYSELEQAIDDMRNEE